MGCNKTTTPDRFSALLSLGAAMICFGVTLAQESSTPLRHLESIAFRGDKPSPSNSHGNGRGGIFYTPCWDENIRDEHGKLVIHGRLADYWFETETADKKRHPFYAAY